MKSLHKQETLLKSYDIGGASVQLVEWEESLWCGKVLYARDNYGEPDVERLMRDFVALGEAELSPNDPEEGWDVCLSFNYLSNQRPSGVFFGFQVENSRQPEGFDLVWLPAGQYLRLEINEAAAKALESEPWTGGVPPFQWVSESIGPRLGFGCADSHLPIVEYYRHRPDGEIESCWLYVPVQKK